MLLVLPLLDFHECGLGLEEKSGGNYLNNSFNYIANYKAS